MLTKNEKQDCIDVVKTSDKDTGSSDVQVSILTKRINSLSEHLKKNHKDQHSRRGLVDLVEQRRKHLSYLKKTNYERYETVIQKLGLRK